MIDVLEVMRRISVDFSMNEAEPMVQRRQCAAAEKSDRIFDRKELARFSLQSMQSNDRFDLTEVSAQGSVLASCGFKLRAAPAASRQCRCAGRLYQKRCQALEVGLLTAKKDVMWFQIRIEASARDL